MRKRPPLLMVNALLVWVLPTGAAAGSWEEVAAAAHTLAEDVEILDTGGRERLILLFTGGLCSAENTQELQSRLQEKLDAEGLDVQLSLQECRVVRARAGRRTGISYPTLMGYAASLLSGPEGTLAAAAAGLGEVAASEVTQKGNAGLMLDLLLSRPCDEHDAAGLGERVEVAAAEQGVEVKLTSHGCWPVVVPRRAQASTEAIDAIQAIGLLGLPSK